MSSVGIVVFAGADELDVIGPFRVFRAARMPVHLIAERPGLLVLGNGLTVEPTATFGDAPEVDVLVVPGGSSESEVAGRRVEQRNDRTVGFIRRTSKDVRITASVCTGAFLLAEAGLLAGRRANTHSAYRDELRMLMDGRGEPLQIVPERVVWDGDALVTSGGVTSGIDLALEVIGHLLGDRVRGLVEAGLEIRTPPE